MRWKVVVNKNYTKTLKKYVSKKKNSNFLEMVELLDDHCFDNIDRKEDDEFEESVEEEVLIIGKVKTSQTTTTATKWIPDMHMKVYEWKIVQWHSYWWSEYWSEFGC